MATGLPTPLAWWGHQLPPGLLRLGVALTLVLEIPAAFLILAPARPLRLAAAASQAALQLLIAATGNYTFFNALTLALCLPLVDDAAWAAVLGGAASGAASEAAVLGCAAGGASWARAEEGGGGRRGRSAEGGGFGLLSPRRLDREGVFGRGRAACAAFESTRAGCLALVGGVAAALGLWCARHFSLGDDPAPARGTIHSRTPTVMQHEHEFQHFTKNIMRRYAPRELIVGVL